MDSEVFYQWLGNYIKNARVSRGMTQETLAKNIRLTRVSVANIEKGTQKVQIHTLIEIAFYLDISFEDLYAKATTIMKINSINEIDKQFRNEVNPKNLEGIRKINEFINRSIKKGK